VSPRVLRSARPLLLLALATLALPYLTTSYYTSIATQVLIFGLFAMSIDLLGGYAGLMPLGHAGILGAAGYTLGFFITRAQAPLGVAVLAAILMTLAVSLLFGLMAVRTSGVSFTMITLAQGLLVWGLSIKLYQITGAENGMRGISRPEFATLYYHYYYLTLAVVAACGLLLWLLVRSPFGLTIVGLRDSESRMRALGYNTTLHKLLVFAISGFFAGLAGILYAWYNNFISPTALYMTPSAEGVLMVILGGAGTLFGPLLGAAIVVVVKNVVNIKVFEHQWWPTLLGLIFVLTILFARDGLLGLAKRKLGRQAMASEQQADRPSPASMAEAPSPPGRGLG
jgi:branched-chain amino acid transport system permease protein